MAWEDLGSELSEMFAPRQLSPMTWALAYVDVDVDKAKKAPKLWKRKPYVSTKRRKRIKVVAAPRSRDVVPCKQCSRASHPGYKRCWKCLRKDAQLAKKVREARKVVGVCAACKAPSDRYRCARCRAVEAEKARRRKAL